MRYYGQQLELDLSTIETNPQGRYVLMSRHKMSNAPFSRYEPKGFGTYTNDVVTASRMADNWASDDMSMEFIAYDTFSNSWY